MALYLLLGAIAAYALYQTLFATPSPEDDRPPSSDRYSQSQSSGAAPPPRQVQQWYGDSQQTRVRVVDSTQQDRVPVPVEDNDYDTLRARAKKQGDLMSQCYKQSQEAYERRDRARAKELSEQGKRHAGVMERLNAKASAIVFRENNLDKDPDEVDLHGLFVKEAITYTEKAIQDARRRGDSEIRLIVGQGTHSTGGVPRLKPAIEDDIRKRGLHVEVDPRNAGVLIVQLGRTSFRL
ncbi:hypothetical protein PAXINDRAFT_104065 [Paxillus involutus ATCC 200175]|uniref:Smr domain-containing protein n=1 Tax=Paxillus involutus ATCC 200175 TaxID=664439 RepID=A0A0C9TBS5_PAXIN|nr:hypothetical protein PAXINDRAFT_104065 [Paxillus involutus ATCC 200175]